jgi:hypothetical protein
MIIPFSWRAALAGWIEVTLSLKLTELTRNRRVSTLEIST